MTCPIRPPFHVAHDDDGFLYLGCGCDRCQELRRSSCTCPECVRIAAEDGLPCDRCGKPCDSNWCDRLNRVWCPECARIDTGEGLYRTHGPVME